MRVLHLVGIDDTGTARVNLLRSYPMDVSLTCEGNVDLLSLLASCDDIEVITVPCAGRPVPPGDMPPADVVLNAVCDPDTNARALATVDALQRELSLPAVNAPERVMQTTRDGVHRLLSAHAGVRMPATIRIRPRVRNDVTAMAGTAGLGRPFLVREPGSHGGTKLALLGAGDRLDVLDQFAFDGREYYVTEFVDFRSPDGIYRKYRVIVIDGVLYPRHLVAATTWNIHAAERAELMGDPAYQREEEEFLRGFMAADHPVFGTIASALGLDFFGVDFALDAGGNVIVFEANACFRVLWDGQTESGIPSHLESDHHIRTALVDLLRRRAGLVEHR